MCLSTAAKLLQSCPTLCDPIDGSPPGSRPWDSPGKNTGVGCHFLLQCMKVKSEREVAQSYPTLCNSMDCSLPGSSIHRIFQARVLEWGAIAFSVPKYRYFQIVGSPFPSYPPWFSLVCMFPSFRIRISSARNLDSSCEAPSNTLIIMISCASHFTTPSHFPIYGLRFASRTNIL